MGLIIGRSRFACNGDPWSAQEFGGRRRQQSAARDFEGMDAMTVWTRKALRTSWIKSAAAACLGAPLAWLMFQPGEAPLLHAEETVIRAQSPGRRGFSRLLGSRTAVPQPAASSLFAPADSHGSYDDWDEGDQAQSYAVAPAGFMGRMLGPQADPNQLRNVRNQGRYFRRNPYAMQMWILQQQQLMLLQQQQAWEQEYADEESEGDWVEGEGAFEPAETLDVPWADEGPRGSDGGSLPRGGATTPAGAPGGNTPWWQSGGAPPESRPRRLTSDDLDDTDVVPPATSVDPAPMPGASPPAAQPAVRQSSQNLSDPFPASTGAPAAAEPPLGDSSPPPLVPQGPVVALPPAAPPQSPVPTPDDDLLNPFPDDPRPAPAAAPVPAQAPAEAPAAAAAPSPWTLSPTRRPTPPATSATPVPSTAGAAAPGCDRAVPPEPIQFNPNQRGTPIAPPASATAPPAAVVPSATPTPVAATPPASPEDRPSKSPPAPAAAPVPTTEVRASTPPSDVSSPAPAAAAGQSESSAAPLTSSEGLPSGPPGFPGTSPPEPINTPATPADVAAPPVAPAPAPTAGEAPPDFPRIEPAETLPTSAAPSSEALVPATTPSPEAGAPASPDAVESLAPGFPASTPTAAPQFVPPTTAATPSEGAPATTSAAPALTPSQPASEAAPAESATPQPEAATAAPTLLNRSSRPSAKAIAVDPEPSPFSGLKLDDPLDEFVPPSVAAPSLVPPTPPLEAPESSLVPPAPAAEPSESSFVPPAPGSGSGLSEPRRPQTGGFIPDEPADFGGRRATAPPLERIPSAEAPLAPETTFVPEAPSTPEAPFIPDAPSLLEGSEGRSGSARVELDDFQPLPDGTGPSSELIDALPFAPPARIAPAPLDVPDPPAPELGRSLPSAMTPANRGGFIPPAPEELGLTPAAPNEYYLPPSVPGPTSAGPSGLNVIDDPVFAPDHATPGRAPDPIVAPRTARRLEAPPQPSAAETEQKLARIAARQGLDGLKGFCPVMLRDERNLVDARPEFTASHNGRRYYFSSAAAQALFEANPDRYAPAATGYDVVHLSLTGEESRGSLDHAVWFRGKLYLFTTAETMESFVAAPSIHAQDE